MLPYTDTSNLSLGAILQQVQPIKVKDLARTGVYKRLQEAHQQKKPIPSLVMNIKEEISMIPEDLKWARYFGETKVWIERVIGYWLRLLKSAEKNYSPTEKEALALKEGIIKFSPIH
jgi:hypothetical protein